MPARSWKIHAVHAAQPVLYGSIPRGLDLYRIQGISKAGNFVHRFAALLDIAGGGGVPYDVWLDEKAIHSRADSAYG